MRDILFLEPHGVYRSHLIRIYETEHELILRMGITDRQGERADIDATIENQRIIAIATCGPHIQGIFQRVVHLYAPHDGLHGIVHCHLVLHRTVDGGASHKEEQKGRKAEIPHILFSI
jgi:hypothetical protein